MKTYVQRYMPGQVRIAHFARCDAIAALDGGLKIRYRDASLSWLLPCAPHTVVTLREGERYVMPCAALVEVEADGAAVVEGARTVCPSPTSRLTALLRRACDMAAREWQRATDRIRLRARG